MPACSPATRCWTLVASTGALDVAVSAGDDDRLGAVLPALAATLGLPAAELWAGSTRLAADLPLTDPALAHGTLLGLGRPGPRPVAASRSSALELHVVGGPDAGTVHPLDRGRHVVGRGGEATVALADPDVSRRHLLVDVGSGGVTVHDLDSSNGSRLDGAPLDDEPRSWTPGTPLQVGASTLRTAGPGSARATVRPAGGGRSALRQHPRLQAPREVVEVAFPAEPVPPSPRRLAWVAVALPAVGGVVLAWVLDAPHFLLFALLSPVVAVGTWLSDRWSGRRGTRRARAAHATELAEAHASLVTALRADERAAEAAHPDLAVLVTAAHRRSTDLWQRRRGDADALTVRVGTGPGESRVVRVAADGSRCREPSDRLPVAIDLAATSGLGVAGPRPATVGVLTGILGQLVTLHAPGELALGVLTTPERLTGWAWLRWVPHLPEGAVHVGPAAPDGGADEDVRRWLGALLARRVPGEDGVPARLVVLVDRPVGAGLLAALRAASSTGVVTLSCGSSAGDLPDLGVAVLQLGGETGEQATLLVAGAGGRPVTAVDHLPRRVAAQLARDLAALAPASSEAALPRQVRLVDLGAGGAPAAPGAVTGAVTGGWSRARDRLVATVGRSAAGDLTVDLCRHGPHALVAGTTGSGKSELLQTLVAGLALAHPPDRCSFLLVDYKGGAAFAEAAALPHTVGLLTDLDGAATARALRSLAAELSRRETLLAEHGVPDVAALPDAVDLARLVIVVDEFAGLAEELPAFLSGLVGIAQRGRSLGVHLVLATQRPAGVVSPEIRANCTLRICLRTTDEAESRDVLGTARAAALPVDTPGRGYLRAGSGAPVLFQAARVGGGPPATGDATAQVSAWRWPAPAGPAVREAPAGPSDLARLTAALARRARETGLATPHRPWCPPLPDRLPAADLRAHPAAGGARPADRLLLGLLDRPEVQSQEPLELDLARAGGWLAVGGARSGRTTLLRTVLAEAVTALSPDRLHVHVLDHGGGGLAAVGAGLPHTGTAVGGDDALRTVRLVDRLAQEVAARRAAPSAGPRPHLLLLVDGAESVMTQLDESDPGRGSAVLLRLVRDGAAAGLTCVLTADRAVPGGRLASAVGTRLVLPLPDRADYAAAGVPLRDVPGHRPPGRALVGEEVRECQLALPAPLPSAARPRSPGAPRPVSVPELPAAPVLRLREPAGAEHPLRLPVGPGGDDGGVLTVDLARTGGLLVAGPPGSGRTTTLQAFAAHLAAAGLAVLELGRGTAPAAAVPGSAAAGPGRVRLDAGDVPGWQEWLTARHGTPGVVVVDDAALLTDSAVLGTATGPEALADVVWVVAGSAAELSAAFRGPVPVLRRRRSGLLLTPGPGDGDLLGVRLPRTPVPSRPGSGWLVVAGSAQRVQVARRAPLPAGSPAGCGAAG
ncbi:FtsK/SpoIIIE domain-containing protein [Geodermatophilus sp. DSM 44513]|uniref:FtsK/SpoIIIE domain-containing protein n=1 Tax=Geodermatophilus sp. DSM 44513 TaxID=1528104 RepID=UPI0012780D6F|nr:FtsK/SpoIIIE domain-containing protein [Geodermatophilus sp. DSM 44513]WNV74731.1 FtsK/SpoIIIE domain-containing protein [Geodermatophilus sp. DSM 44513]